MQELTLVVYLCTFLCIVSAVVSVWSNRKKGVAELEADVEELALLVERMGKAQRREKMARVRSTTAENNAPLIASQGVLGEISHPPNDPRAVKAAIRAKLRGVPAP